MAPIDKFSLVEVDIFKQLFKIYSTLLRALVEAHPESPEWAARFKKDETIRKVLRDASKNGVLRACLKRSLLETCIAKKKTRDVLFRLHGYQKIVS